VEDWVEGVVDAYTKSLFVSAASDAGVNFSDLQVSREPEAFDQALHTASEPSGGLHGSNRLGGNATADVLTFGRIAAKSALRTKYELNR
jgi:succinate dehydrogenase/fumarate reductase flavoprotein subunit